MSIERKWDAIVLGAGMGGGAAAYELTSRGYDVLLIEKGLAEFPEATSPLLTRPTGKVVSANARLEHGMWPTQVRAMINSSQSDIWPYLGCGVGGSSLLYAATLHRLDPMDFAPQTMPSGEVVEWPYDYQALEPYYQQIETMFGVRGTPDPLQNDCTYDLLSPQAMNDSDRFLFGELASAGLHPYRIHVAVADPSDCPGAAANQHPQQFNGNAQNKLIVPAQQSGKLTVLDQAEVVRLTSVGETITAVEVKQGDAQLTFAARAFVLAAGTLNTPLILQQSISDRFPHGIGNDRDLVGRNLMFHASDMIALWPKANQTKQGPGRSIALRDFYTHEAQKLGEFQSMGLTAGYGDILTNLHLQFDQTGLRNFKLLRHLLRIPAFVGAKILKEATVFATIVEDFPYLSNRVVADDQAPSGIRFEYKIPDELRQRVTLMRRLIKQALRSHRTLLLNVDVSLNFGHSCGTCRAGTDPQTSVLDPDCKVHDVANLYIVDGSFMPTSGGTNPSLTIAANALRVGKIIAGRLDEAVH